MVLTFNDLLVKYKDYTDVKGKIRREIKAKRLIQISRGKYETNSETDGKYLANVIYGPSYLSFDYVLSKIGMIPEAVYNTFTSATFHKKKSKSYKNDFGYFTYCDVPDAVYSKGVLLKEENGYSYQIASAEKAVCDKLYSLPPVNSINKIKSYLFDDLRFDEKMFWKLNMEDIKVLAPLYRSNNLKYLLKIIERGN